MVFLDAFSSRYISMAPFLNSISRKGYYTPLSRTFALGKGLGTSIYTGTTRNTNKVWCDYVLRDQPYSNPSLFKFCVRLCDLIPSDKFNKYSRYAVYRLFNKPFGTPNIIPPDLLDFFKLKPGNQEIVTMFDHINNNGKQYCVSGLSPSLFDPTSNSILEEMKKDCDLFFIKFGALDKLGHKYGPESDEIRERVSQLDKVLKNLVESAPDKYTHFVFFSDHGMTPVHNKINLFSLLDKLPIKFPEDYLFFLHSTIACFWFNNNDAKRIINEALQKVDFGDILDRSKLEELGIDKIGSEYGELIFTLKEGYVFFPDFYRKKASPKGMHGYAIQDYDRPILIIHSLSSKTEDMGKKDKVGHIDIMPTVLDFLDLPIPSTCEGDSLIIN